MPELKFEKHNSKLVGAPDATKPYYRAKVPGGWLVDCRVVEGGGLTFVPDPNHEWDGGTLD